MPLLRASAHDHFSLGDLEAFDPQAPDTGRERRFCCPLPTCQGKPIDTQHRSLSVNVETGAWFCYRCEGRGKLIDFWTDRPKVSPKEARQAQARRAFALLDETPDPVKEDQIAELAEQRRHVVPVAGTPGAAYLTEKRGIPVEIAAAAGVLYSPTFYGRPAVVFPLYNRDGALVALGGRYIDGKDNPKARIAGNAKPGVFLTSPDALDGERVVLVEGPACALTFAQLDIPTVSLYGVNWPKWLPKALAFKRVIVATDADQTGDTAAAKLIPELQAFGAKVERWRPSIAKDWNDAAAAIGLDALRAALADDAPPAPEPTGSEPDDARWDTGGPVEDFLDAEEQIAHDLFDPPAWQPKMLTFHKPTLGERYERAGIIGTRPAKDFDVPAQPSDPHAEALELQALWHELGRPTCYGPNGWTITDLAEWMRHNDPEKWEAIRWSLSVWNAQRDKLKDARGLVG